MSWLDTQEHDQKMLRLLRNKGRELTRQQYREARSLAFDIIQAECLCLGVALPDQLEDCVATIVGGALLEMEESVLERARRLYE